MRTDPDTHALRWRLLAPLAIAALSGCTTAPPQAPPVPPAPAAAAPAPMASIPAPAAQTPAMPAPSAAAAPAPTAPLPVLAAPVVGEPDVITPLMRYADRVRALPAAELALEINALGDPGNAPQRQLQLAIALMHSPQAVDTARSLGLLQRVAANPLPEANGYRSLARLLAGRLLEQRKLEENVDRQGQQLREQQRRIEQLNERLEAMRAIERSLNARPPAAAPRSPGTP